MNNKKILVYAFSLLILSSFTYAIGFDLNTIMYPFRNVDIAQFYLNYYEFIDAIIYLILFLSLSQIVFTKVYSGDANKKSAKTISVAISLILTVSMTLVEMRTGFYLGGLESVALIIFLLIIAILLFNLFGGLFGDENKSTSASMTYLIIYGLLVVPFGKLNKWIDTNAGPLSAVLALAAIVAFIYLIIQLFNVLTKGVGSAGAAVKESGIPEWFKKKPKGDDDTGGGGGGNGPNSLTITEPQNRGYNPGDLINPAFTVSGPGYSRSYDYDIHINTHSPVGRRKKVAGTSIVDPIAINMGLTPTRPGTNILQVTTYKRVIFGNSNKILAQAQVTFTVGSGGGGGAGLTNLRNLITVDYAGEVNNFNIAYQRYAKHFHDMIQMNHDVITGVVGSRYPTAAEWATLRDLRDDALVILGRANALYGAIVASPDYPLLTAADLATLTALIHKHGNIYYAFTHYDHDGRAAYSGGAVPPAILIIP